MRAKTLTLQAFGPYYKKQTISFDELGKEAIFLITGPTGSGKTTIFDGICYALYGRASGADREQDSLRSHFADTNTFTEVEYEFILKDQTYKITRSPKQKTKRKRGEGETDVPARACLERLNELGDWEIISARINEINDYIEELLQFDFDQFSKMVLIPQGEFRKLITENSREREKILQKIFQTYFYSDITDAFKNKALQLKEDVQRIEDQIELQIAQLEDIDQNDKTQTRSDLLHKLEKVIEDVDKQLTTKKQAILSLNDKLDQEQKKYNREKQLEALFEEKEEVTNQLNKLELQKKIYDKKREKLDASQKAERLKSFYENLKERSEEFETYKEQTETIYKELTQIEEVYNRVYEEYKKEKAKENKRDDLKKEIGEIEEQKSQFEIYANHKKNLQEKLIIKEKTLNKWTELNDQININEKRLQELADVLNSESSILNDKFTLEMELQKLNKIINELSKYKEKQDHLRELRIKYKKQQNKLSKNISLRDELVTKLDENKQAEREQMIQELRLSLSVGDPCPLCGTVIDSETHQDSFKQSKLLEDMKLIEEDIKQLNETIEKQREVCIQIETKGKSLGNDCEEIKNYLQDEYDIIHVDQTNRLELDKNKKNLIEKISELQEKLQTIEIKKKQKMKVENDNKIFKQTFDQLEEELKHLESDIIQLRTIIKQYQEINQITTELSLDDLETKLKNKTLAYKTSIENWQKTEKHYQDIKEHKQKSYAQYHAMKERKEDILIKLKKEKDLFAKKLQESIFTNEAELLQSFLSENEQQLLLESINTYDTKRNQFTYRMKHLENQLQDKKKPSIDILEASLNNFKNEIATTQEQMIELSLNKEILQKAERNIQKLIEELKKLEDEYYFVGDLAETTSGNNDYRLSFERFVLASFLDEILLQANNRFGQMTDYRFELTRSQAIAKYGAQSGLDLEIIDYHTGKNRSVKTLSGGEGFKAALSLALGLADVVQQHTGGVQMDTMFIDEGFGTLDEISLQQAIECLKSLEDSNRLLGIISHVPQLKDEIHAKLMIEPSNTGSKFSFSFSGE